MKLTKEASAAYAEVERKVSELQDAIIALGRVYETNCVGLDEWCEHMEEVMYDLSTEMFSEEDEE
jgi:hypothetical protein